jgi:hypothetical protein
MGVGEAARDWFLQDRAGFSGCQEDRCTRCPAGSSMQCQLLYPGRV